MTSNEDIMSMLTRMLSMCQLAEDNFAAGKYETAYNDSLDAEWELKPLIEGLKDRVYGISIKCREAYQKQLEAEND